eukprot:scaffold1806_cov240-Pinguiococcus_pyrenoidosus.AAC.28
MLCISFSSTAQHTRSLLGSVDESSASPEREPPSPPYLALKARATEFKPTGTMMSASRFDGSTNLMCIGRTKLRYWSTTLLTERPRSRTSRSILRMKRLQKRRVRENQDAFNENDGPWRGGDGRPGPGHPPVRLEIIRRQLDALAAGEAQNVLVQQIRLQRVRMVEVLMLPLLLRQVAEVPVVVPVPNERDVVLAQLVKDRTRQGGLATAGAPRNRHHDGLHPVTAERLVQALGNAVRHGLELGHLVLGLLQREPGHILPVLGGRLLPHHLPSGARRWQRRRLEIPAGQPERRML